MTNVEYELADDGVTEALYDGAVIASYEPGRFHINGTFHPEDLGVTVSFGQRMERWKWFGSDALGGTAEQKARQWIESHLDNLRDY